MVVYNLRRFYAFSSTLSSHFGIWVNSVLCCGSLEHFDHFISHFSKRGIHKVLLGEMIKSPVWGVLWNLIQGKQSSFPGLLWGCVIPSVLTAPFLVIKSSFHMNRTTTCEMPEHHLKSWQEVCDSHQQTPFPCALVPENPWYHTNSHGWIIWFVLYVESVLVMQILQYNLYLFTYKYALNQSHFASRCLVDDRLCLFCLNRTWNHT